MQALEQTIPATERMMLSLSKGLPALIIFAFACSEGAAPPATNPPNEEDVQAQKDTAPPEDTADTPVEWGDCDSPEADKKSPGCLCTENSHCTSGWCVEGPDGGSVCTDTCIDTCPSGWACKGISNAGSDVTFICVPKWLNLCRPCQNNAQCGFADSECLDYGAEGQFCSTACISNSDCPAGYTCSSGQCRYISGVCPCSKSAIKDAATTQCGLTNEFGTCPGERTCGENGLSDCIGQIPVAELCDGEDNNCNGESDEGLDTPETANAAGTAPPAENSQGVCENAVKLCAGKDGWQEPDYLSIEGFEVVEFACDGLDNDCDGSIDEHCNYLSYGNNFGDGTEANSDNGQFFMNTTIGTPRFVGSASNSSFKVHHSLPKGDSP